MPSKTLPCNCIVDWSEAGTKLFMCGIHQFQYNLWEGSEEEFVKMIATPAGDGNEFEAEALSELR
jgi:hypothetical protein